MRLPWAKPPMAQARGMTYRTQGQLGDASGKGTAIGPYAKSMGVMRECQRCERPTARGVITIGPEKDVPYCLRCGERKRLERLLATP